LSFKANVIVSLLGASFQRGGALLLSIYLVQRFNFEFLGAYALLLANVQLFSVLGVFGVTPTASKFIAQTEDKENLGSMVFFFFLVTSVLVAFISCGVYFFSETLAIDIYGQPDYVQLIELSALVIACSLYIALAQGVLYGLEEFKVVAKLNAFFGLGLLLFIPLGLEFYGIKGMALGMLCAYFLVMLIYLVYVLILCRPMVLIPKCDWKSDKSKILLTFSLPSILVGGAQSIANWLAVILLLKIDDGSILLAVYHIVNQWYSMILFLPNVAAGVLLPMLVKNGPSLEIREIAKAYLVLGMLCAGVLSFGSPIIETFYGSEFTGGWLLLVITFITGAIVAYKSPFEQYLNAHGYAWSVAKINFVFSIVFCLSLFLLLGFGFLSILTLLLTRFGAYIVYISLCIWKYRAVSI